MRPPRSGIGRKRRSADIDSKHIAKPGVLADALMDHVLAHAASALVDRMGSSFHVFVMKTVPDGKNLHNFGFVGFDQELVTGGHGEGSTNTGLSPVFVDS